MKPVTKKLMRVLLVATTLAFAGVLLGIVPISAGFVRGPIENAVRDATGLDFSVAGSIIVRLGPTPSITTGGLTLGEPATSPLLTVDSLSARVGLFPLLSGRIHLKQFNAVGVQVDHCSPLPQMASEPSEETGPLSLVVEQVDLENISLRCGTAVQGEDVDIDIRRMSASASEHESMQLEADGSVMGIAVALTMTGGELNALLGGPESFPLDLSLTADFAKVDVSGELLTPLASPAIRAEVVLHSSDLPSLSSAFDIDLPALGALHAEGRVQANLETVAVVDALLELGESRITVDANADLSGARPYLELTAILQQLDLAPFIDRGPAVQVAAGDADPANIDLRPIVDVLDEFDADLQVTIQRVLGAPLQLGKIEGSVTLADGIVDLRPLTVEMLATELSIDGSFDSGSTCPALQLHARVSELDLAAVNQLLALDQPVGGHVGAIGLEATSCGNNLFAHRDSLRAEAEILRGGISIGDNPLPFTVEQMHTSISYSERNHVHVVGEVAGEPVQATLAVGSLAALLGQTTWPIDVDLQAAGGQLQLNGQAGPLTDQFVLDAALQFDVPQIGTLHSWTDGPADAALPLQATSQLHFDANNFVADSIELIFGESDLGGQLIWKHAQDPDTLAVTLNSTYLDLDEISAALLASKDEQDGIAQSDTDAQAALAGFDIPPLDLDLTFDALNILELDLQDFDVSGRLREGLIDAAKISATLEGEIQLRGSLDLDLRSSRATGALNVAAGNVDVGNLLNKLNLADDLQLRADDIEVSISSEGATPRQLLLNASLQADLNGFNWILPSAGTSSELQPRQSHQLSLAEVRLTAGPDRGTTWESQGEIAGVPMEIRLEMPSLQKAFGDAPELPLTLLLAGDRNVAMINARFDRSVEQDLLAHVVMSGAVMTSENRVLAELRSPLADYEISTDIALANGEWQLPNLQMRLGSSVASGTFSLMSGGERRHTDIVLHAPHLQTDDLIYWTTNFFPAETTEDDPLADEEHTIDDNETDRGVLAVLRDYISEYRKSDDLDLSILVDELHAGPDQLGGAELKLHIDENSFILKPLAIKSTIGDVDAEYTWKHANGNADVGLKIHAGTLSYGGLLRLVDPESQARGVLYLDVDIGANAAWTPDVPALDLLLNNANGNFELAAWPEDANAGFLDLWTGNLVLALLPEPTAEQASILNCLAMRLEVEDGVLKTGTALMDSTTTIVRARGEIDLGQETLDLLVAPQAKREKFLSMSTPVMVTGSFDDFQIGVEPAGMIGTAMKLWMSLIYVPFKWLTGERYPEDGTATCFKAMDAELTPELQAYLLQLKKGVETN